MTETTPPKKSDLGVRAASAVVMVAVAGTALWLGGWVWTAFVVLVALGVLWEWWGLVQRFAYSPRRLATWMSAGLGYVGLAATGLITLRTLHFIPVLLLVGTVIGTDVGAYFAGRTIGGPKIAPTISPSKTWAGLIGGMIVAGATFFVIWEWHRWKMEHLPHALAVGALVAVIAQAGDFFESWMKRKADFKDSGTLIPGHGGLFDRTDGLIAVSFVLGLWLAILSALQA